MEVKFKKGQSVRITKRNGEIILRIYNRLLLNIL